MATAALVVIADVVSKGWAVRCGAEQHTVVPGVLSTTLTTNTGATFGILRGYPELLAVISVIVLAGVMLLWWLEARHSVVASASVGMLVGGALGNLYDRIRLGYVVDFLQFDFLPWWPAFNVADAATVVGVGLVVLWLARPRSTPQPRGATPQ